MLWTFNNLKEDFRSGIQTDITSLYITVFNTNLSGLCQILLKNQDRQIKTFLKLQTDFKF